jgi:hypothetical protein
MLQVMAVGLWEKHGKTRDLGDPVFSDKPPECV